MIKGRLDPSTAASHQSIWVGTDRARMEREVQQLNAHVAGPRHYALSASIENDSSYPIPLAIERSLADDFAFIAACQPRVDYVSAVTLEQSRDTSLLIIRLAANTGVAPEVKGHFDRLMHILRKHARKELTRDECQTQIFDAVVQLNYNRILGRLGSKRFRQPSHMKKTWQPLSERIRHLYIVYISKRQPRCVESGLLSEQITKFESAFRRLETSVPTATMSSVQDAIRYAYDLSKDGTQFPKRLRDLGCSKSLSDAREARDVGKVANYWRIARNLTICSAKFRLLFANIEWHEQSAYGESTTSSITPLQFVHAEIQLITYYELNGHLQKPRAIGASKEACFLCDSFIQAHGRFSITGAHRQLYSQWTVPDLREYSPETVQNFRNALLQVSQDVSREYANSRKPHAFRPFPLQSAINLDVTQLSTPSRSTLVAVQTRFSGVDKLSDNSNSQLMAVAPSQDQRGPQCGRKIDSACHRELSPSRAKPWEEIVDVHYDAAIEQDCNWVEVYASFVHVPADGRAIGCSVTVAPADKSGSETVRHRIPLRDLSVEHEMTLKIDDDREQALTFIVVGPKGQEMEISCSWEVGG